MKKLLLSVALVLSVPFAYANTDNGMMLHFNEAGDLATYGVGIPPTPTTPVPSPKPVNKKISDGFVPPTDANACHAEGKLAETVATKREQGTPKRMVLLQLEKTGPVQQWVHRIVDRAYKTDLPPQMFGISETLRCDKDHGMVLPGG
ncbi:hypothetical protein HF673_05140 [Acidithiobacillus thiooxidans]|jgi:hypothetical protein|uniref:hypothetical protein n=1 Tax=Acidithiobacillus TaxID=119977 RepID=UPI0004E1B407|nr:MULTISPECIES: hypothetical protein [Acidithiobacillus]MBU2835185.1 hypothetical protein [Acidithiobacillus thiooxidans]MDA8177443.1 hypothetical protein [Acidithiobacillus sp.]